VGAKPRVEFPHAIHHVTARGNAQEVVFVAEIDYLRFLGTLAVTVAQFGWLCHSFCLLPNHFHLLVETPEPNLARGMRILNGTYAQGFNKRHRRVGHVFQGPYRTELVNRDGHLLEVCRYIALNPLRAGLGVDWPWNSFRALAGLEEPPSFLSLEFVRSLFGGAEGYRKFVADGIEQQRPGRDLVAGVGPRTKPAPGRLSNRHVG
jgi:REP-associated tyrosine transposase